LHPKGHKDELSNVRYCRPKNEQINQNNWRSLISLTWPEGPGFKELNKDAVLEKIMRVSDAEWLGEQTGITEVSPRPGSPYE
ncbi:MAG: hypothetical protein SCH71_15265, partial [Desulfobulbaceae bacterium]|nr:hypothetical protein [Desulfobulbaceae bacterium]